jgi:hypothetical protein
MIGHNLRIWWPVMGIIVTSGGCMGMSKKCDTRGASEEDQVLGLTSCHIIKTAIVN